MVRIYAVNPISTTNIVAGTQVDFIVKTDEMCNIKVTVVNQSDLELQVVTSEYGVTEVITPIIFADTGNYSVVATTEKDNVVFDSYHWNVYVMTQEDIDQIPKGIPIYDTKKSGLSAGLLMLGAVAIAAFS